MATKKKAAAKKAKGPKQGTLAGMEDRALQVLATWQCMLAMNHRGAGGKLLGNVNEQMRTQEFPC